MQHRTLKISQQRGFSFLKLVLLSIVIVFVLVFSMKLFPVLNEYWTIQRAIKATRELNLKSQAAVRDSLGKFLYINEVRNFDPVKDFTVEADKSGQAFEISFAYSREVPLIDWNNMRIMFDFSGTTDPTAATQKLVGKIK